MICWKWSQGPTYRSQFTAKTVNILRHMVRRHYPHPHRFVCVTDDAKGIEPDVEIIPAWNDFAKIPNPNGPMNPSCYRRLRAFAPDIGTSFGERFVSVDLDTVIVRDVTPLWHRPEPFVIWGETDPRSWYNGSMFLLTAGARAKVWQEFNPKISPMAARKAGKFGSDQGWISFCLGKGEATWGRQDGVYSYRVHLQPNRGQLPNDARIVFWHGRVDPWSPEAQRLGWVREHWS